MFLGTPVGNPPINTFVFALPLDVTDFISVLFSGSSLIKFLAFLLTNIKAFLASPCDKFFLGSNILPATFLSPKTNSDILSASKILKEL